MKDNDFLVIEFYKDFNEDMVIVFSVYLILKMCKLLIILRMYVGNFGKNF